MRMRLLSFLLTVSSSRTSRIKVDAKVVFVQLVMIKQSVCKGVNISAKGNIPRRVEHYKV